MSRHFHQAPIVSFFKLSWEITTTTKMKALLKFCFGNVIQLLNFGQLLDFFNWQKKSSKSAHKYCNCGSTFTKVTLLVTDFSKNAITIAFYGDCPLFSPLLLLFQFWPKRGHDMKDLIEI